MMSLLCTDKELCKHAGACVSADNRAYVSDLYFFCVQLLLDAVREVLCVLDSVAVADKHGLAFGIYGGLFHLVKERIYRRLAQVGRLDALRPLAFDTFISLPLLST